MSMIPDESSATPVPAPVGHNQPPSPIEVLSAAQAEGLRPYEQRRDEFITAARKKQVTDRISAGDAGDIIRLAGEVWAKIDQERRERTDPYRKAADAAKGKADEFWEPVFAELRALRLRLKNWTDAEDKRIADQKAEQDAEMDRMRKAAAAPAPCDSAGEEGSEVTSSPVRSQDPAPAAVPLGDLKPAYRRKIRGDLGATVATVERKEYHVVDIKLIPDWIMSTPTVHQAIIAVVKSMAKHAGPIPGIETTTVADNTIR